MMILIRKLISDIHTHNYSRRLNESNTREEIEDLIDNADLQQLKNFVKDNANEEYDVVCVSSKEFTDYLNEMLQETTKGAYFVLRLIGYENVKSDDYAIIEDYTIREINTGEMGNKEQKERYTWRRVALNIVDNYDDDELDGLDISWIE
jgi:hypothetical protein